MCVCVSIGVRAHHIWYIIKIDVPCVSSISTMNKIGFDVWAKTDAQNLYVCNIIRTHEENLTSFEVNKIAWIDEMLEKIALEHSLDWGRKFVRNNRIKYFWKRTWFVSPKNTFSSNNYVTHSADTFSILFCLKTSFVWLQNTRRKTTYFSFCSYRSSEPSLVRSQFRRQDDFCNFPELNHKQWKMIL